MTTAYSHLASLSRQQKTIKQAVSFSGIGIHTGTQANLRFCPAKENTGILFKRVDLPGHPIVPAAVSYVQNTDQSTTIGIKNVKIHTVEHVLAAVCAYQLTNLIIEVSSFETPIGNGGAEAFVKMIEEVGIQDQDSSSPIVKLQQAVYWSEGDIHLVALPHDEYKISYTLSYPDSVYLRSQFHSISVTSESFKKELAPCRTFILYRELSSLIDRGLIKGGSLDNGVIIKDDVILSKGGLFFPDEMVRHKVLDMIGDLSLIGFDLHAHIIAIRSGHASNIAFAKKLLHSIKREGEK